MSRYCWKSWLRSLWRPTTLPKSLRPQKPPARLRVELLEDRLTPAVASLSSSGVLTIDFTAAPAAAESVTVTNTGLEIILTGNVSGATSSLVDRVSRIVVADSGGSTDQLVTFGGPVAFALSGG